MSSESDDIVKVSRSVSWKQGMFIALGVPLLILPSLGDVSSLVWGCCIFVWTVSVLQGFVQNLAYGEMVTVFPNATGLPGCAQAVFGAEDKNKKKKGYNLGKLLGAFSAWCYWFAWCPVVVIFTMMIGDYLVQMFDLGFEGWAAVGFYLVVGIVIVALMLFLGLRGLEGGAKVSTILALASLIPIVVILLGALAKGMFDFSMITTEWTRPGFSWSPEDIVLILGCFALGQWSACAWETAAVYGPEYKDPGKDVPKALFGCGIICLIMYFFVSTVVYGSLGYDAITEAGTATLKPIAEYVFGDVGSFIALFFLIVAMVLIIQTGFLGSSRSLNSIAEEGNLPAWFAKKNSKGMPVNAMIFVSLFNIALLVILESSSFVYGLSTTSMTVLTASAIGYCIANGIALAAYVKTKRDPKFASLERPFKAPRGWTGVITAMVFVQFCVWLPSLLYWSYYLSSNGGTDTGITAYIAIIIAATILLAYIPIWFMVQKKNQRGSVESYDKPVVDDSAHLH